MRVQKPMVSQVRHRDPHSKKQIRLKGSTTLTYYYIIKKKVRRNECALGPFEPSWCFNVSVKERTHSFLGLVPTPLMSKKKMVVGRMTTHASYICYAASRWLRPCLLLLLRGALFADRDGLSTAVSAFGRFLRSFFLFCINYFLIQPFLYSGS